MSAAIHRRMSRTVLFLNTGYSDVPGVSHFVFRASIFSWQFYPPNGRTSYGSSTGGGGFRPN